MKKIIRNKKGVSEIVGVAVLLGITISLFTIVQLMAISYPFNNPTPSARITASIDDDTIILFHQGGESLPIDTKIIYVLVDSSGVSDIPVTKTAKDTLGSSDKSWGIGEKLLFDPGKGTLNGWEAKITVVDVVSNSIIMQGTIRGG